MLATQSFFRNIPKPLPYDAEWLIVAGGGGCGGGNVGAGGGAGGYRTSFNVGSVSAFSFERDTVYTCTVGLGGAGANSLAAGTNGGISSINGSDVTEIQSAGGGGGGTNGIDGSDGGSGGGSGATSDGAGSTFGDGNVPSTSPVQGYNGGLGHDGVSLHTSTGGGGGAGQLGGNADQTASNGSYTVGGTGGNGEANTITGASVTYAGGGGGASDYGNGVGVPQGGTGGGGVGYIGTLSGSSINANQGEDGKGGGAGAGDQTLTIYNDGGNGVVILRVATANYSGTTSGTPTVSTDGSDTIIKFTGTGTYTA